MQEFGGKKGEFFAFFLRFAGAARLQLVLRSVINSRLCLFLSCV
jgi:hypothetical protein